MNKKKAIGAKNFHKHKIFLDRFHDHIDQRAKEGKLNEEGDFLKRVKVAKDGTRTWSF